ncbi:MAG: putative colanic acid biosynthesis acetyltransferase WcaF [Hyphomicrobiaceae bacterium]|jgi:putative colanic acid biosynthesis acetyltransferase WcaF
MTKVVPLKAKRCPLRLMPSPGNLDKFWRFVWLLVQVTLYRWSPVQMHGWRRILLRWFGARIDEGVHPYPTVRIWAPWNLEMGAGSCLGPDVICYSVGRIKLGAGATVSQGGYLCAATHDCHASAFPLIVGDIEIGCDAWVATEAFIGPGLAIGDRAVVGARAVVVKDVSAGTVVAGNPARVVGLRRMNAS